MFDKIGNLPLHPLVVHTVVIGVPLAVLWRSSSHSPRPGNGRVGRWRSSSSEPP